LQPGALPNTPEALQAWSAEPAVRYQGRPIAVCLEQSRGAVVYQLSRYAHLVITRCIPPWRAFFARPFTRADRLRRRDPDTPETRLLQVLVEQRRGWVDERARYSNRRRTLHKFSAEHNSRSEQRIQERIQAIYRASDGHPG
jgi:hypothetical protein